MADGVWAAELLLLSLLARAADFGTTLMLMPRFAAAFFIKARSSSLVGMVYETPATSAQHEIKLKRDRLCWAAGL